MRLVSDREPQKREALAEQAVEKMRTLAEPGFLADEGGRPGKRGILYGVGVGPGDAELLTLKASRLINENRYIAYPGKDPKETLCCRIVKPVMEHPEEKIYVSCHVPMTKDKKVLAESYDQAASRIGEILDTGENVVFLTLGDPTVYATYMYVHERVKGAGYEARIVNGVPSFCAAAARLGISLAERSQLLHVIPSSYDLGKVLSMPGTKVLMKSASKLKDVKEKLVEAGVQAYMVENCCMENERVFMSAEEIDENAGYLSLIIVKDEAEGKGENSFRTGEDDR